MKYQCVATSVAGFVQQVAVQYVAHGYRWYVEGWIPESKSREAVLEKLVGVYGITHDKTERWRRKRRGVPNVQLLCFERHWVLLATKGDQWRDHSFYRTYSSYRPASKDLPERRGYKDLAKHPLQFEGYSIGWSNGHPSVRIARSVYLREKAYFEERATKWRGDLLVEELRRRLLRFEQYAPVRTQLGRVVRAVNRERKMAGYSPVPKTVLWRDRRIYRPFEPLECERLEEAA